MYGRLLAKQSAHQPSRKTSIVLPRGVVKLFRGSVNMAWLAAAPPKHVVL